MQSLPNLSSLAAKKILFVVTSADLSGAPIHVRDLATTMLTYFARVTVVFGETGSVRDQCAALGVATYVVPAIRSTINPVQDVRALFGLLRIIRQEDPDLIHAHSTKAGMIARVAGWLSKVPVVFTVHGWGFGQGRRCAVSTSVKAIERRLRSCTARYIAVSEHDRSTGITELGINPDNLTTIHNGIPALVSPRFAGRSPGFIMVARDAGQKDYDTLLRAINGCPVTLVCVGEGTITEDFRRRVERFAGASSIGVHCLGVRNDVSELLSDASVLILSSKFEGLPISIIEGMRGGLAIVASDVGGVGELVKDGENGYLFPPGDDAVLRMLIMRYRDNPDLARAHGRVSYQLFVEKFGIDTMILKTIDVYTSVFTQNAGLEVSAFVDAT